MEYALSDHCGNAKGGREPGCQLSFKEKNNKRAHKGSDGLSPPSKKKNIDTVKTNSWNDADILKLQDIVVKSKAGVNFIVWTKVLSEWERLRASKEVASKHRDIPALKREYYRNKPNYAKNTLEMKADNGWNLECVNRPLSSKADRWNLSDDLTLVNIVTSLKSENNTKIRKSVHAKWEKLISEGKVSETTRSQAALTARYKILGKICTNTQIYCETIIEEPEPHIMMEIGDRQIFPPRG